MKTRSLSVLAVVLGLALGFALGVVPSAEASRNASGTYSLPAGQPVVSGTTISSTTFNTLTSDMATEITSSLDRSGRGAMLAPLQCTSGTVSAPGLTFSSDTNTGLYRAGADNPAIAAGGVQVQQWTATGAVFPLLATAQAGVTVTQSSANTRAITATGNGTESGFRGTGGSTSGTGGQGFGGAPNGNGLYGEGDGTGVGLLAQGGDSSGRGVSATGGAPNGNGVVGTGDGTGSGVQATGGDSSGSGGTFTGGAPNGTGLVATGTGTGVGAVVAGGTAATTTDPANALELTNGYIDLQAVAYPNSNVSIADRVTPKNIAKAWGKLAFAGGGATTGTVSDGYNITSAAVSTSTVTVTVAADFADTNYTVVVTPVSRLISCGASASSVTAFTITCTDIGGGSVPFSAWDIQANLTTLQFVAYGAQ